MAKITSMERTDALQLFMFLLFFLYLGTVDKLIPQEPWHSVFGIGGIFLFFGLFFAQEYVLFFLASHYGCLSVRIRPSNKRVYLYHTRVRSRKLSTPGDWWESRIELGEKVKLPEFGVVKDIVHAYHEYTWAERVNYSAGIVRYKGFRVRHNHMAEIEFWERPTGRHDIKRLEPEPSFNLAVGSNDYELRYAPRLGLQVLDDKIRLGPEGTISGEELKQRYTEILLENDLNKDELREVTRQARDWHQAAVLLGEKLEQVQNEMAGLMKSKPDFRNSVIEEFLIERDVFGGIDNAIKKMGEPRFKLDFDTKTIGYVVIAIGILTVLNYKWDTITSGGTYVLQWLSILQNQIFIALIIIAVSIVIFLSRRKR